MERCATESGPVVELATREKEGTVYALASSLMLILSFEELLPIDFIDEMNEKLRLVKLVVVQVSEKALARRFWQTSRALHAQLKHIFRPFSLLSGPIGLEMKSS